MNRQEFRNLCGRGVVCLDGATGTQLILRGMPAGVSPEAWTAENPAAITQVQQAYADAGSRIVYTCTFGGNLPKLREFGLEEQADDLNRRLAAVSRAAVAGRGVLVFGDLGPTGQFTEPLGPVPFDETVEIYRRQAAALLEGGVDGFAIETMMDLQEARAALLAVRSVAPDIAVIVTMTFDAYGRTLAGNSPESALVTLQAMGADAFGCNCSTGPEKMAELVARMRPFARIPLVAKPNAGLPVLRDGRTIFEMSPEEFGGKASLLVEAGAGIVGGCCGTTPEHLAAMSRQVAAMSAPEVSCRCPGTVSSPGSIRVISPDAPFVLVGERLNPTGKKALQAELRAGNFTRVEEIAAQQCEAGSALLDVNVGMSGIDEVAVMKEIVKRLTAQANVPLCIDTTNPEVAEAALKLYPGRALFNSISAEKQRLEEVLPIAAKYGAMLVLLPITDEGIPATAEARIAVAEGIMDRAAEFGYAPEECCVDGVVMTISTDPNAAKVTLDTIRGCAERGWNTICGLSNVSFGMPRRDLVNRTFLGMAAGCGLNMAIANPCLQDIADTVKAADALRGADDNMSAFIAAYSGSAAASAPSAQEGAAAYPEEKLRTAVLKGNVDAVGEIVLQAVQSGSLPGTLVDDVLIPAITEVGDRFERKEYFLPQLIRSADAMRTAMDVLQPMLAESRGDAPAEGKIILATVKGDIHDIGKNIVAMMLRNCGFQVVDLGKDVPAEVILDKAVSEDCRIIGLSALMTTTMGEMKNVIDLAKERGMTNMRFMVGGAVVDAEYAASIGAEYANDALAAVKTARRISHE